MSGTVRVALAQYDFPVGAIEANKKKVLATIRAARDEKQADILLFPALTLCGPVPGMLLQRPALLTACARALQEIAGQVRGIAVLIGWPEQHNGVLYHAISLLRDGAVEYTWRHPVQGIHPSNDHTPILFSINGVNLGVANWQGHDARSHIAALAQHGADLILLAAAQPFTPTAITQRQQSLTQLARNHSVALAWVNAVGGQDQWVFDGSSLLVDRNAHVMPPAKAFTEQLCIAEWSSQTGQWSPLHWETAPFPSRESLIWQALVMGTRDYLRKNGFSSVWLGLSGGIDSALVLAIAVEAMGAENVTAVRLPSRYTVALSNDLAQQQADALGVTLHTLPIEMPFTAFLDTLAPLFAGRNSDITEENLQSRCRGVLMMALTNKFGGLLLTTGNKSELSVGYGTIYGDMCGGYAPLKDLYKTDVFALSRWRNAQGDGERIPVAVIDRPPSAELRDNQRDEDSLPPYSILDALLERHIDQGESGEQLVAAGFEPELVRRVLRLVRISAWKRQQYAPGPRFSVSNNALAHYSPITSGWREE